MRLVYLSWDISEFRLLAGSTGTCALADALTGTYPRLYRSHFKDHFLSLNDFMFQIFDFLKTSITRSCKDLQFLQASRFLQDLFPQQYDVTAVILEVVENRWVVATCCRTLFFFFWRGMVWDAKYCWPRNSVKIQSFYPSFILVTWKKGNKMQLCKSALPPSNPSVWWYKGLNWSGPSICFLLVKLNMSWWSVWSYESCCWL